MEELPLLDSLTNIVNQGSLTGTATSVINSCSLILEVSKYVIMNDFGLFLFIFIRIRIYFYTNSYFFFDIYIY